MPSPLLTEIPLFQLSGLRLGHAQDEEAKTGVTVLLFDKEAKAGVDISGGGPASRETPLASPLTADNPINAIVLSGGSAYGLAAGDGVMRYLEEHGIGYPTGFARVPLVCQSCIYDLGMGRADVRPDAAMGYEACVNAEKENAPAYPVSPHHPDTITREQIGSAYNRVLSGSIGAGCGASVGKLCGMERSMKSGVGVYAVSLGNLQMAAVVVVNALGDIFDPRTGEKKAGLLSEDQTGFADSCEELYRISQRTDLFTGSTDGAADGTVTGTAGTTNTTIGAVITNGRFSKAELSKIASMTRCAYARCIRPVGTLADGDSIYAVSMGEVPADINVAGTLAAEVMEQAILRAVNAC